MALSEVRMFARLIPARAGNIPCATGSPALAAAHPRSRGEHRRKPWKASLRRGSSPLARGTFGVGLSGGASLRLIPARAGNIRGSTPAASRQAAHPRSRGEHAIADTKDRGIAGSSPLARGTLYINRRGNAGLRLIPARAGNMFFALTWLPFESAHPRSRGEHWRRRARSLASCGSSPLARGTSRRLPFFLGRRRLIPARAGNICPPQGTKPFSSAHPRSRGEHEHWL